MDKSAADPAEASRADRHAIKGVLSNYQLTVEINDFETWLELWDENGCRMAPDSIPAVGIEQIREQMAPNFAPGVSSSVNIEFKDVYVEGNLGFIRSDGSISRTFPDGKTISLSANVLTVFKKHADETWKIYIDCFNFH